MQLLFIRISRYYEVIEQFIRIIHLIWVPKFQENNFSDDLTLSYNILILLFCYGVYYQVKFKYLQISTYRQLLQYFAINTR